MASSESSKEFMMPSMDTPFITIAEASHKTGRSASTIRRLIHTVTEASAHADRASIKPTPDQVKAFKKKGENFTWTVREELITKHFGSAHKEEKKAEAKASGEILSILRNELELKNNQIEKQFEVIQSLNERIREGNILMGALHKQLALPSPEAAREPVVEASSTKASKEDVKKASKKVTRRGLFGWLRGATVKK